MKLNLIPEITGLTNKFNYYVDKAKDMKESIFVQTTTNHKDNLFSESLRINTLAKELDNISRLAVAENQPEIGILIASIIPQLHSISEQITWEASYLKD